MAHLPQLLVVVFLVGSMSAIGLGLRLLEILAPLHAVKVVAWALVANFVGAPLLAVAISRALRLDASLSMGLLLLGLSAGAPFMPKVVALARGEVALAVGLMVLLMVVTTACVPLLLPLLSDHARVDVWSIARAPVQWMLLPLIVGLAVRARAPALASRLRQVLDPLSTLAMITLIVLILVTRWESLRRILETSALPAALLFAALTAACGWLVPASAERRAVLGLGTGLRNFPAALILATQCFPEPDVAVMILVTTLTGIVLLLPAAWWTARRAAQAASDVG